MDDVLTNETAPDQVRLSASKKPCRWCGAEMSRQAVVCRDCRNHQSVFREHTIYLASIASFATLLGTAAAFIVSVGAQYAKPLKQWIWPQKVATIEYLAVMTNRVTNIVIANSSTKPIFVASVTMRWDSFSYSAVFERTLQPDEFSAVKEDRGGAWNYKGVVGTVKGAEPELPAKRIEVDSPVTGSCYAAYFYSDTADDLNRIDDRYAKRNSGLFKKRADFDVVYFEGVNLEARHEPVAGWVVFYQREPNACGRDLVPPPPA